MKKVLFIDILCPMGHKKINEKYIQLFSPAADLTVVAHPDYYSELPPNVKIITKNKLNMREGKLLARIDGFRNMRICSKIANSIKPEYIFFSSYETIASLFIGLFFNAKKAFLLSHNNIDETTNRVKRFIYNLYARKVNHIVFEEFIKNYLIETFKISSKKIHVLPHPTYENNINIDSTTKTYRYKCVGISNSNNDVIVKKIIDIETEKNVFKKSNCKIILKSKIYEFDNGYLKVFKGFISSNEYSEYMSNAKFIYMPFPDTFNYRVSGTLIDAISQNKSVISHNIGLIKHYEKKYPNICITINNVDEFVECVLSDEIRLNAESYEKFKFDHSDIKIVEIFKSIINT
jgi:hypothetical protein